LGLRKTIGLGLGIRMSVLQRQLWDLIAVTHPESQELQAARRLLASFGRRPSEPDGIRALAEALRELSDLAQFSSNERERTVAGNLLRTYARKGEARANELLADFDSIADDEVEAWHDVMREFEQSSHAVPESFRDAAFALIRRLIDRLLGQMSPAQRKVFKAKLQSG